MEAGATVFSHKDENNAMLDASLKMWQDILVTGGKVKNGSMNYDVEINLVDKNVNSLKQLNQYFDKLSLAKKGTVSF